MGYGIMVSYLSVTGWQGPLEYGPNNGLIAAGCCHGPGVAIVGRQLMGRRDDVTQFESCD